MLSRVSEVSYARGVDRVSGLRAGALTRRLASLSALAGTSFLYAYMVLHALHVAGIDPKFVQLLSAVPLFATCGASVLAGSLFGVLCHFAGLDHGKILLRMPKLLALSVVLFTLEILFFP
ncbi:MAG TPA: hypothetical protein VNW92_04120 [Polyangiaceae bacterium]|nr:hypothetical protein [Polyangiaceae bacterium]